MCGIPRTRRRPGRDGFAGRFIQDIAAAASMAAGQNRAAPTATMPLRRRITALRPPHTVKLCIHCRHTPAGFWVSHIGGMAARRPWGLSCCQGLERGRFLLIPFEGHGSTR